MAKGGQKRKAKEHPDRDAAKALSPLKLAFQAYEAGDAVMTRKAAREVLRAPEKASEAEARELGKRLFDPAAKKEPATPKEVAEELLARTEVPRKAYLFVLLAAAVIALMVTLALLRS